MAYLQQFLAGLGEEVEVLDLLDQFGVDLAAAQEVEVQLVLVQQLGH